MKKIINEIVELTIAILENQESLYGKTIRQIANSNDTSDLAKMIKKYVKFDNEYFNFLSAAHSSTYRHYLSAAHFTSEDVAKQLHEKLEQLRYIRKEMKKHYKEGNVEEFQNALKRKNVITFGINAISGAYGVYK